MAKCLCLAVSLAFLCSCSAGAGKGYIEVSDLIRKISLNRVSEGEEVCIRGYLSLIPEFERQAAFAEDFSTEGGKICYKLTANTGGGINDAILVKLPRDCDIGEISNPVPVIIRGKIRAPTEEIRKHCLAVETLTRLPGL